MLLSLQSSNDDYSTIRSTFNIPWECKYIKYYLSSVNFKMNAYTITHSDYIKFHQYVGDGDIENLVMTISFRDEPMINQVKLLEWLNVQQEVNLISFGVDDKTGRLLMTTFNGDIVFDDITPRARMVFGLMSVEIGRVYEQDRIYAFDIPIYDFASKLYIISKQGQAVHANVGAQEYTPSVLASIDTFIRNGLPVIVNFETYGKPIKNIVNIDSFKSIELQLVDMMFQPIQLLSPMFITMKVKPCNSPMMRLKD